MNKCKCGCDKFWKITPVKGVWQEVMQVNPDGALESIESSTDGIIDKSQPKTIRCTDCGKRYPNPDYKP